MRKVKIGIVGCGGIANNKHLPAIQKNGNYEIVAFCDIDRQKAEDAKEKYGTEASRVYTD
ncbi:MAG: putative dehydrogenase, partial [Firmicutes bacterium]|nr:putative dehydrogenase [Bacillota bacterium]